MNRVIGVIGVIRVIRWKDSRRALTPIGAISPWGLVLACFALMQCSNDSPSFQDKEVTAVETERASTDDAHGAVGSTGGGSGGSGGSADAEQIDTGGSTGGGSSGGASGGSTAAASSVVLYRSVSQEVTQKDAGKLDILFVVDNSGSMTEEQAYLKESLPAFIAKLEAGRADFQVGVTTTDQAHDPTSVPGSKGNCIGLSDRKVLFKGNMDILALFKTYVAVGINGSGNEYGLLSARQALDNCFNQAAGSATKLPLVRPDAFLSIIVVSDEEDYGLTVGAADPTYYPRAALQNYLTGLKGKGRFSISAVTGTRDASGALCTSDHAKPKTEGTQYIDAAKDTGGVLKSICGADWPGALTEIATRLNEQIVQITLTDKPKTGSLVVKVDGVVAAGWSFVEATNSIKFSADVIPVTGAKIQVEYLTARL